VRRRLLVLLLGLVTGVLAALEVPLAVTYADRTSLDLFVTQLTDTTRFASLAEPALRDDRTGLLTFEVKRYDQLYGVAVLVVDRERAVIVRSRPALDASDADVAVALDAALAGRPAERPGVAWPWNSAPYVVAEPVGRDNQVSGAVVTVGPTRAVRDDVARRLALLIGGGLAALLLAAFGLGVPVVRWVLRPVARVAGAAVEISRGRFDARVAEDAGSPELRRLTDAFNAMADSVERALDRQRFFVSQASHQLRNPLTALRLRVDMLGPHVAPAVAEEHEHAVAELDHLAEVLESLLRLAGTDATRAERRPVDVAAVALARIEAWRPAYERTSTPLRYAGPTSGPVVDLLPDVLDQVLDALLDNAVKFAAGTDVRVEVGHGPPPSVTVTDSGPGLSDDDLPHVGERFWRSPTHQNTSGTGLGLAIAVALIEACGGTLGVDGAATRGLQARVLLPHPVERAASGGPAGTTAAPPDAAPGDTSRSPSGPTAADPPGVRGRGLANE
jgi:signal transduction histidine kinase